MGDVSVEELRERIARLSSKVQPPVVETSRLDPPRRASTFRGAPGAGQVSTHDHFGHMVRSAGRQWCDEATGGCGQEWVFYPADDDKSFPKLYAVPYRGSHPSARWGTKSRSG